MKPMQYQNCGHYNPLLDRVLSESNVKYCGKCGFASMDAATFEKHLLEHTGPKFYCFYCNKVSFSESELHAHLKQHTSNYPYKCPHCGQGYIRRQFLMKHIERLHKNVSGLSAKPDIAKITHAPVSSALPNMSMADSSTLQPAGQVTVALQREPVVRRQDEPIVKALNANVSHSTDGDVSIVDVHTQHSRALTVSLPDEVTIPAGCTVELVEVKTVNGTKELKLRLVSKQEKSAIKDSRNTVPQSALLEKPLTSTPSPQISAVKSGGLGSSNRQQCESQMLNVERRAAVPFTIFKSPPNQVNKEKNGHKRALPHVIELDSPVPNKNPKIQITSKREITIVDLDAPSEPAHLKAALSSLSFNRLNQTTHADKRETSVCPPVRAEQDKKKLLSQPSPSVPLQSDRDANSRARRKDPEIVKVRKRTDSKFVKDAAELSQQNLKSTPLFSSIPSTIPSVQVRPPLVSVSKNGSVENQSFPGLKTLTQLLAKTSDPSNPLNKKGSGWSPVIKSEGRADGEDKKEPESFPVISSVFSLSSQQPNQPLVTALCGMVMDKTSDVSAEDHVKSTNGTEKSMEAPASRLPEISLKEEPNICKPLSTGLVDFVKEEKKDTDFQQDNPQTDNKLFIKEEKRNAPQTDIDTKCVSTPPINKKADQESSPKAVELVDASVCTGSLMQFVKRESGFSSMFPTVSLKRMEVAVWEKSSTTQNVMSAVSDCDAIYPMPLKVDQLVKRPGPNQPVVVLNHPKPRAHEQGSRTNPITTTESSLVVPKCQILKMRLGKVMGQKYEVTGCTVRVLP